MNPRNTELLLIETLVIATLLVAVGVVILNGSAYMAEITTALEAILWRH